MIPSIEKICYDLAAGLISAQQAIEWLHIHAHDAGEELRDSFAMAALQGILASHGAMALGAENAASFAFHHADAMLAERSKP